MKTSLNSFRWCPLLWLKADVQAASPQPELRRGVLKSRSKASGLVSVLLAGVVLTGLSGVSGCGTPGLPRPPSLALPEPVGGLTALRMGDVVTLHWTTPRDSTDNLALRGAVGLRVCRVVGKDACRAGNTVTLAPKFEPGVGAQFRDTLPAELVAGSPQLLNYTIELLNHAGKSAGPSNAAYAMAGESPAPLRSLAAEVRADGVVLRWEPVPLVGEVSVAAGAQPRSAPEMEAMVRIHRNLVPLTTAPSPDVRPGKWKLNPAAETPEVTLLLPERSGGGGTGPKAGIALDAAAVSDRTYIYTAERLRRITLEGQSVEMAGPASEPVTVVTRDVFPPAVPSGLVAVTVPEEHAIDLSWDPDSEGDLAGYLVYRRETGGVAARISTEMLVAASYRDAGSVAGRRYFYSVSAIDLDGNESARCAEVEEGLPAQ